MNGKAIALQQRTHRFFVRVLRYCERLPRNPRTERIEAQLIDSAGSTDSNYRAACRARSTPEFIAKIGVAAEEADELTAIFVKSRKTAETHLNARKRQQREAREELATRPRRR